MADRIRIDADTIAQHAGRLESVRADVRLAQDAAASVNLGGGAFGLMCAFMVPLAATVQMAAQASLGSAAGMLGRSITELRGIAADFSTTEDALVSDLERMRAALEAQ
jgi:hypothetical protein